MHAFETLIRDHEDLLRQAKAIFAALNEHQGAPAIRGLLDTFIVDLSRHLAIEDDEIYPHLLRSSDAGEAELAGEAIGRFASLATELTRFHHRWSPGAIAERPDILADDFHVLINRIGARIRTEDELLYPMALRAAHIRLRT